MHLSFRTREVKKCLLFKSLSTLPCSSRSMQTKDILEGLCFPQMSQLVGLLSKIRHASEIKLKTKTYLALQESDYRIHCQRQ